VFVFVLFPGDLDYSTGLKGTHSARLVGLGRFARWFSFDNLGVEGWSLWQILTEMGDYALRSAYLGRYSLWMRAGLTYGNVFVFFIVLGAVGDGNESKDVLISVTCCLKFCCDIHPFSNHAPN
jgi:hypothetical protein